MAELDAVVERDGDRGANLETESEEYGELIEQVMPDSLEAVAALDRAGLLTITINLTPDIVESVTSDQYSNITLDATECFENGSVLIVTGPETTGGMCSKQPVELRRNHGAIPGHLQEATGHADEDVKAKLAELAATVTESFREHLPKKG